MGIREEFEAWYLETSDMDIRPARIDDHYVLPVHNVAWCAWQASRTALVIELPNGWGDDYINPKTGKPYEHSMLNSGQVRDAINAAGVRTK